MYKVVALRIQGLSGLLMHNPAGSMTAQPTTEGPKRAGKKIPKPYDEARNGLYVNTDSSLAPDPEDTPVQLFVPSDALREAGLIAAKSFRDTSRRGNASWEQRFGASVFLSTDRFLLEDAGGKPLTSADGDWAVHTKRAVVQGQGIMRSRGLIREWALTAEFEFDTDTASPADVAMIIRQAGKFPGLLDYRPGKKGPFGRFSLVAVDGEPLDA